ncbi:uncharacterized protein KY384_000330 [Bacidia gigantensis]|uniref:uncharacterized protein n=1 Tax=Bacidia gigantensis TaxID=2732470 RepID=UPI001D046AAD|nr:uncharacterized protein KY384_000330 [Bacidia gigantensis]KAG8526337.1 hypothetical protein KY384_000330 [Bacidia gigantensis]
MSSLPSCHLWVAVWLFLGALVLPSPLERRAIDTATFDNLAFFEQFAAASYCQGNTGTAAGGKLITCPIPDKAGTSSCPLVEADKVTAVYEFQNSLITDVTGYIALDTARSLIVLAFRGSKSLRNWIADVTFGAGTQEAICPGCEVWEGFAESWNEAKTGVLAALKTAVAANPTFKVVVTGHSLGGAIAVIAAAEIRNEIANADLYTYGQPRIGKAKVSDYITGQGKGANFRVTHKDDPVPRLPPLALGYKHISPEYYIDVGDEEGPFTADRFTVFTGDANTQGNEGHASNLFDWSSHGWYFNEVGACYSHGGFEFKT